jgi:multicomponent Na+:H+ antiporter subunit D
MNAFLVLPILIPLTTAAVSLLAWRWRLVQRRCGVVGAAALCGAALGLLLSVRHNGVQAAQIGDWPAPFGITLVADLFSALLVVVAAVIGLSVTVYSLCSMDTQRESFGYYPLLHILLMGVCGAFLTGDIFNLYVWFEVMLIASFVLLALGGEQAQIEGAIKYVTLNLLASAVFLSAIGILYGMVGTLNMADLAGKLAQVERPGMVTTIAMLFLVAFGLKAAVFPLFFWLPASYHTPPAAIAAVFAGLLTKVGTYALIRSFTLLFVQDVAYTHTLILIIAALTMLTGVLGAVAQQDFRRILSFQVVSHIGYMLMGLGLFTTLGLAGSVFYMVHHIIVITSLFLLSGIVQRLLDTAALPHLGGVYHTYAGVACLFFIPAFSLAGIPPFSGFIAKLALVRAGLEQQQLLIVVTALGVSLLTLLSMAIIWAEVFWKPLPRPAPRPLETQMEKQMFLPQGMGLLLVPTAVLALATVAIGLGAEALFPLATQAAEQLLDPVEYIQAVMGNAL